MCVRYSSSQFVVTDKVGRRSESTGMYGSKSVHFARTRECVVYEADKEYNRNRKASVCLLLNYQYILTHEHSI